MPRLKLTWLVALVIASTLPLSAHAQYNSGSGYNPELLTPADKDAFANPANWPALEQRGSLGVLFPDGRAPLTGKQAERWITEGKPLRAVAFAGMPTVTLDAWAFGKELALINADHARKQAQESPVFQRALKSIVARQPGLREAAKRFDLSDAAFKAALERQARQDSGLGRAYGKLQRELAAPVVAVRSGFGDAGTTQGAMHYAFNLVPALEAGKPGHSPVADRVAGLLTARFSKARSRGEKIEPLALVGHCSGGADAAAVGHRIPLKYRRKLDGYSVSASMRWPAGMRSTRAAISATDRFGGISSYPESTARAKVLGDYSHMLGKEWAPRFDEKPAMPIEPLAKAFGRRVFPGRRPTTLDGRADVLKQHAERFRSAARDATQLSATLDAETPSIDRTMPVYKIMQAKLGADARIFEARATLVESGLKRISARRYEQQAKQAEQRDPARAAQLRSKALGERQAANRLRRSGARALRQTRSELLATVRAIPKNKLTEMVEYSRWKNRPQEKQLGMMLTNPLGYMQALTRGYANMARYNTELTGRYLELGQRYMRQMFGGGSTTRRSGSTTRRSGTTTRRR